ncbi:sialidase family protein [Amycolatopsis sp. FDAARGOS 1241]|uniref:sialidase family protein n=1 Tax=Amycolatopsis sp. FDAARGOS 1241 TaxID=2778070 RepID=UPI00194E3F1B|nr:sialidase family protein [Amycolatopsis sp. FDAARGOS 1241]QRP43567.1 exo-alpha-sialidase [Amycolatopsis sp. FDAARGOS 1241]
MRPIIRWALAFVAMVSGVLVPAGASAAPAPAGRFDQQALFNPHQETGYACFRIPAVVRSTHGTLLAFAEGRRDNCGDTGDIDLVLKRSTDGGTTWSPLQVVNPGGGDTHGNPVPIVDSQTGRIVLITTYNKGRDDDKACDVPCPRTPHAQYSDDDGRTWSAPVDISAQAKLPEWDSWYASGPVHGIQLTKGRHAGRLVFGVNAERSDGTNSVENYAALIYSDDHGRSWHVGAVDSYPHPVGGTYAQKPSEVSVVELPDGTIYAGGREQGGTDVGNRDYALSRDGGETFSKRFATIPDLVTPMVQGSLLRLQRPGGDRILFASPSDTDRRRWMMTRSSYDDGRTWEDAEQGTRITNDWSGYSDLVQLSGPLQRDAEIGLMYEGGAVDARDEIRFARFDENYLGWRRSAGPATPDVAQPGGVAHVLGGASVTPGVSGGALTLDGVDDFVRVPYSPAQLPGSDDFTFTTWFSYGASKDPQALLWLGGMNSAPQVWLRGEPASHRLIAMMTTAAGSKSVTTTQAYDDQQWHRLALERTGGQLKIRVDGVLAASGPDSPGSVSQTVAYQLQLGERLDGANHFKGSLDDVRFYRRALQEPELTAVGQDRPEGPGPVVQLPFDRVH